MKSLLNVENEWDGVVEGVVTEGPIECISELEKTGVVGEVMRAAGQAGVKEITEICNRAVYEGKMPTYWELSYTYIAIYKERATH